MKESTQAPLPQTEPDEIDLLALLKTLWNGRKLVLKTTAICGVIGLIVALSSPKEFVATTIMVPSGGDASSKLGNMGGLGGLAAMAGINLNSSSNNELSPLIYPKIVASLPYQLELMKTPLSFSQFEKPISFYDYYSEPQKSNALVKFIIGLPKLIFGLPGTILNAIRDNEPERKGLDDKLQIIELTNKQEEVRLILSNLISLSVNPKEGFLILSSTMAEAKVAAQLGQQAQELLQQYIIEFKIKKAKANLDFIQQRFDETSRKFESLQEQLAAFRDRNKNVSSATARTEEERITSQYNLIYSIYLELAKQLEQAKIQVKQDTPVFTIIEPISVPTTRTKPNRTIILIIWLFFGVVIGTAIIFGKGFLEPLKNRWNEIS